MQDGRRQVGEFLFPGDVFGWDALDKHDFGAEAVTQVTLHRYSRGGLAALADQDCTLSRRIRELTARQIRAGREHMILLGRMTASERIASFLLEMARRMKLDERSHIELPMIRGDIADYLGLTTETVCRQLTQLRREGTIAINGTKITIANRRMLEVAGYEGAMH
jgi:CRP-like cAMP-binding protein